MTIPVFDGHNDVLLKDRSFLERSGEGHLDLEPGGPVVAVAHVEGAEAIDPGLDAPGPLHAAGLRSLGITWSRANAFGHGVPFASPCSPDLGPGLTDAGRTLVRALAHGNWLRVLRQVQNAASSRASPTGSS